MNSKRLSLLIFLAVVAASPGKASTPLEAGVAHVDISPTVLPALRNGGFLQASSERVDDPLMARCLVLGNRSASLAIVIVDSCMLPRTLCDQIKQQAVSRCDIRTDRILIAATHTHSAPSAMNYCLGSSRDERYVRELPARVAEAIVLAAQRKQPAKIGWTRVPAADLTHCRRWIRRRDRVGQDPFGESTVRAMMHPGYQNPDYVCPAGPVDPWLSVVHVVSATDETPLCLLANLSMHYFGAGGGFSADYFGEVTRQLEKSVDVGAFVAMMSQGTSGDLHWMNYGQPQRAVRRTEYARQVTQRIQQSLPSIQYHTHPELEMLERRIVLSRRVPSRQRLAWAQQLNEARGQQAPRNRPEVYAQQATWIADHPREELVLQTVRVGDLAFTAIPNEVYGITGLKLKEQSPFAMTVNFELANGAAGYIPPPSQHALGGYTTWPARTAGLEIQAEPTIVEALVGMLETLAERPRRTLQAPLSPFARAVLGERPHGYWRLDDLESTRLTNEGLGGSELTVQGRVATYLRGATHPALSTEDHRNRALYLAGGRLQTSVNRVQAWSVGFWCWNGAPERDADVCGTLIATPQHTLQITGKGSAASGRLSLAGSQGERIGTRHLEPRQWYWVVMCVAEEQVHVYLNGKPEVSLEHGFVGNAPLDLRMGTDLTGQAPFDGKCDELILWTRALESGTVAKLWESAVAREP